MNDGRGGKEPKVGLNLRQNSEKYMYFTVNPGYICEVQTDSTSATTSSKLTGSELTLGIKATRRVLG